MNNRSIISVAIVGAGPYGISVAAHLKSAGVDFRIFGVPVSRWREQMPKGMFLKSEGFSSNLSDPERRFTLAEYCKSTGTPYADTMKPVPLDDFTQYALTFQRNLVPNVEEVMVTRIDRESDWFELKLADGTSFRARKVVIATGLEHANHVPAELAGMPRELASHSSAHHDLSCFKGKDVTVIGGGQSAMETAALLAEQGVDVRLLVRSSSLAWNADPIPGRRSLYQRVRHPESGLGPGLQVWAYCTAPAMFRYLPRPIRFERVKNILGPAGGWWLRERVVGRLPILTDHVLTGAEARAGRLLLFVRRPNDGIVHMTTDHVIAATGYRFAVERLPFLSMRLKSLMRTERKVPVLSPYFESSIPGLYFTGLASAHSFGPSMRFLVGADYTSHRLSGHLVAMFKKTTNAVSTLAVQRAAGDSD